MKTVTTIGLDVAKNYFQLHGVNTKDLPANWSDRLLENLELPKAARPSK